jgi:hypothetical protein
MPALVAGIHVFLAMPRLKTWMAGTSPAMTFEAAPDFAALNPGYDFPASLLLLQSGPARITPRRS